MTYLLTLEGHSSISMLWSTNVSRTGGSQIWQKKNRKNSLQQSNQLLRSFNSATLTRRRIQKKFWHRQNSLKINSLWFVKWSSYGFNKDWLKKIWYSTKTFSVSMQWRSVLLSPKNIASRAISSSFLTRYKPILAITTEMSPLLLTATCWTIS